MIRGGEVVSDRIREATEEKSQEQGIRGCCFVPEREHLSHHGRGQGDRGSRKPSVISFYRTNLAVLSSVAGRRCRPKSDPP